MSQQPGSRHGHRRDRPSGLSGPLGSALGPERRSSPRMTSFDYTGAFAYTLTLNTANAIRAFDEPEFVEQCLRVLAEAGQLQGFEIRAYCFMPDHVHLLVI